MATLLLIIIYIAFLGRGMPDSITGSAWPMMASEFNVPDSYLSFITITISVSTAIASIFSPKSIKKFGNFWTTCIALFILALTMLAYYFSKHFIFLCILAIPLGVCAGVIDNALNDYIAAHYKSFHFNIMHSIYGIGAALSPFLISIALDKTGNWHIGYLFCFILVLIIAIIFFFSKKLWKKNKNDIEESSSNKTYPLKEQLKNKKLWLICACIFLANSIEALFASYGNSFLVSVKGYSTSLAPTLITCFCLSMGLGRMVAGFLSVKVSGRVMLISSATFILLPLILLFFNLPEFILFIAFCLIGFMTGPLHPLNLYLTTANFGKENSSSIMGTEIATAYIGFASSQLLFSALIDKLSINIFPIFAIIIASLMFVLTLFTNIKKKDNKVESQKE